MIRIVFCLFFSALVAGCLSSSFHVDKSLEDPGTWVVLPLINDTESLTAEKSASTLVDEHLRRRGVSSVVLDSTNSNAGQARHVVTGRIMDWRYEKLTRPRAKVKIALHVYDIKTRELLWRKQSAKTGGGGESIVSVANDLLAGLVAQIDVSPRSQVEQVRDDIAISAAVEALASAAPTEQTLAPNTAIRVDSGEQKNEVLPVSMMSLADVAPGGSIALYYATNPPIAMLSEFDRVVLEPDAVSAAQLAEFNSLNSQSTDLFAYLSVGEVGPSRQWRQSVDNSWVLGVNETWNSAVLDLSNPDWREFLISRADDLVAQGYAGFFLDTMDSYQLVTTTESERQRQQQGLISFIASLKERHPQVQLIANRGFELLPSIATYLDVIAAESLYGRWHATTGGYQDVPKDDHDWLLGQLRMARTEYGLEAMSIDYVDPSDRQRAREVSARIASHGIIPWVSTPGLDQVGVGLTEVFPREVLMLFDSRTDRVVEESFVHRLIATPLEYFGYVPRYIDLASDSLPAGNLSGRYAGIVSWTEGRYSSHNWSSWLEKQVNDGVPLALLGNVGAGASAAVIEKLGLRATSVAAGDLEVTHRSSSVGFEREPVPRISELDSALRSVDQNHSVQLSFKDKNGAEFDAVGLTPWGGYGVTPGLVDLDPDGNVYWVIEPYEFVRKALRLADIPQPDVTTQAGRRIVTAHIDGDALPSWAEMPGRRLGAEVLYEDIIKPYKLPHSISIVEAEMVSFPEYDDRRERMFNVMRKMFREEFVELATHTFSHPFKWRQISAAETSGKFNLPVPGYVYSIEREIDGSVDFINRELAPEGKKVEAVFWSGDAVPGEDALARVAALGLQNINGGNTTVTRAFPAHERLSPMVRPVGKYDQIYAPVMNENVYTNDWTGPFDGFRRVLETFEMTETPRRLKPIGIYYHFYSGTKISAMRAMHEVYDWTVKQDIAPLFVTSYSKRVGEFRRAQVSRSLNGVWTVSGLSETQSIRWLGAPELVDISGSVGIAGQRQLHDGLYIHPSSQGPARFRAGTTGTRVPQLVSSNGQIVSWKREGRSLSFEIKATMPVELILKHVEGCHLAHSTGMIRGVNTQDGQKFSFTEEETGDVSLRCPS